jgi:hypothetical protein
LASYELVSGSCNASSGPCIANASSTINRSGIGREKKPVSTVVFLLPEINVSTRFDSLQPSKVF